LLSGLSIESKQNFSFDDEEKAQQALEKITQSSLYSGNLKRVNYNLFQLKHLNKKKVSFVENTKLN